MVMRAFVNSIIRYFDLQSVRRGQNFDYVRAIQDSLRKN